MKVFGLVKSFGNREVLSEISFTLKEGSKTGLLGLNGVGKTTLLCIMGGILRPSKGEVEFGEKVGMLPQQALLPLHMSGNELYAYYGELSGHDSQQTDIIEALQLAELLPQKIKQLSHGQRQLLAIGQAFLGNPPIVLLDEPFNGLDAHHKVLVRNFIAKQTMTVVISSHILDEIDRLCTDVLILHKGKLIAEESIGQLAKKGSLISLRVNNISDALVSSIHSLDGIISVLPSGDTLSIRSKKDVLPKILAICKKHKIKVLHVEQGQRTEDLLLSYIT
ncbi:ABC transporter ATP-binding protein [Candidatus Woesearchaeota archaeon]|nr:ABC transporter ATP-binding protein [Candidatus Woesearchaeota archaeon]